MSDVLDYLIKNGKLTEEESKKIQDEATKTKNDIEDVLLNKRFLQNSELLEVKSKIFNLPNVDLFNKDINKEYLGIISQDIAENYKCVLFNKDGNTVYIAMLNPLNYNAKEAVEFITRKKQYNTKYFVTTAQSIRSAIKQYNTIEGQLKTFVNDVEVDTPKEDKQQLEQNFNEDNSPIIKIVSTIIEHAIEEEASDIHIEPGREFTKVRYRIDGDLYTSIKLPRNMHSAIIARIKIMSNLKIDETRIPQDGRIALTSGNKIYDFRVSIIPISEGEKVVMRILDSSKSAQSLEDLGIYSRNLELANRALKAVNGIILVCGPTGSGKSTTLFSMISILNEENINIVTLEDPVEYTIPGVNHSQIRPEIGYTFANGIRSFLRQDPDIIMVGEIRDTETAELCIHAGLTGHLVLSTLHSNDAIGAIPRLIDMGVEPFLLSSSLNLLISQRLVKKICKYCKAEVVMDYKTKEQAIKQIINVKPEILKGYKIEQDIIDTEEGINNIKFYHGKGCAYCNNTGYKGRLATLETIEITEDIRKMMESGSDINEIKKELEKQDFVSLEQDGIIKALKGEITLVDVKLSIIAVE